MSCLHPVKPRTHRASETCALAVRPLSGGVLVENYPTVSLHQSVLESSATAFSFGNICFHCADSDKTKHKTKRFHPYCRQKRTTAPSNRMQTNMFKFLRKFYLGLTAPGLDLVMILVLEIRGFRTYPPRKFSNGRINSYMLTHHTMLGNRLLYQECKCAFESSPGPREQLYTVAPHN